MYTSKYFLIFIFLEICIPNCSADVFIITKQNQTVLNNYRVALVAYTADWCFFSRQLAPIFSDASNSFIEEAKNAQVLFGRVDCEANHEICSDLKISKYPTIKVHKYGFVIRKEFRQQRTIEALVNFVREHSAENITVIDAQGRKAKEIIDEHKDTRDMIFGTFPSNDTSDKLLQYFKMGAHLERDNCAFVLVEHVGDSESKLYWKDSLTSRVDSLEMTALPNLSDVRSWISLKCTPPVRELTFANAEDITEEALPLFILFHNNDTKDMAVQLRTVVSDHLEEEKKHVNFVYADGHQFTHPLSHMGKTVKDLPLICIDSFTHMYVHPKHPSEVLSNPAEISQFIKDLFSGKLHKEFHYGRDTPPSSSTTDQQQREHSHVDRTDPPESVFNKLKPSSLKYTLLHDEL